MESNASNAVEPVEDRFEFDWIGLLLAGTFCMTYLTVVKEGVLYQSERNNWRALVFMLAMRGYYPLLLANVAGLAALSLRAFRNRQYPIRLRLALAFLVINVALFSANNVSNLIQGKPLHGLHKGIGW